MDIITNYDVLPFSGQMSVVVTRDGEVLKALADIPDSHLDGYGTGSGYSFFPYVREITTNVGSDVADGDCEVRIAFRETASSPWQFMRHENGSVSYVRATAKDGKLTLHTDETPHPDVTLLAPLESDGDVYAGESRIYAVFDGETNRLIYMEESLLGDPQQYPAYSNIAVFDWKGTPLELIRTGTRIENIHVDERDHRLYALYYDDNGDLRIGTLSLEP